MRERRDMWKRGVRMLFTISFILVLTLIVGSDVRLFQEGDGLRGAFSGGVQGLSSAYGDVGTSTISVVASTSLVTSVTTSVMIGSTSISTATSIPPTSPTPSDSPSPSTTSLTTTTLTTTTTTTSTTTTSTTMGCDFTCHPDCEECNKDDPEFPFCDSTGYDGSACTDSSRSPAVPGLCFGGACVGCDFDLDGFWVLDAMLCLGDDCDDGNPACNPVATEICDDLFDNDCDGDTDCQDSDCSDGTTCGPGMICCSTGCLDDQDGDGFVVGDEPACESMDDDCDDTDANINTDASEVCDDTKDNDCDGFADCSDTDCPDKTICDVKKICCGVGCFPDNDADQFIPGVHPACQTMDEDCDDNDANVNPSKAEGPPNDPTCQDGKDNDCDFARDILDPDCCPPPRHTADTDGDGWKDHCCPVGRVVGKIQVWDAVNNVCNIGGATGREESCYACTAADASKCPAGKPACCNQQCYDPANARCCNAAPCNKLICSRMNPGGPIEHCCDKNMDGVFMAGDDDCCPDANRCAFEFVGNQVTPPGPPGNFPHPNDPRPHWECVLDNTGKKCYECNPGGNAGGGDARLGTNGQGADDGANCGHSFDQFGNRYAKKCCFGQCFDPQPLLAFPGQDGLRCCGDPCNPIICPADRDCCMISPPGTSGLGNYRCCRRGMTCVGNRCVRV